MTVTEFLQTKVPFLNGLTQEQAHALAVQVQQQAYARGQTVILRGTTVDGLFIVASGKVGVWAKPEKSKILAQVAELGPGDIFGETSILEMTTAGATIKANEDETLVFLIPQAAFRAVLSENPELDARAQALIAERKKKTRDALTPARPSGDAVPA